MNLNLTPVHAADAAALDACRTLLREYQQALGIDLSFQDFEAELAALPGAYGEPGGILLLGTADGVAVCCGGVRSVDGATAELKRVYVRPAYRKHGYGRVLVERLLAFARTHGYARILLDTLPSMAAARGLYAALGFREIAPYTYNPIPGTTFLGLTF
jgi:GNAT superfamily N-acetyltransferase